MPNESYYRAKTKAWLEARGGTVARVSNYNTFSHRQQDLFGIFDLIAVGVDPWPTLYVQFTSGKHHADRKKKMLESPALKTVLEGGNGVVLVSWRKPAKSRKYAVRAELLTLTNIREVTEND